MVPSPGQPKPQRTWNQSQKTPKEQRETGAAETARPWDEQLLRPVPRAGQGHSLGPWSLGMRSREQ